MKADKEQIKKSEAIEALNSIEKIKNASLKRALPPRWYSAVLALLAGLLVLLSVSSSIPSVGYFIDGVCDLFSNTKVGYNNQAGEN